MADSNNRDHPEIVEAEEPDRPDLDQTEAAKTAPAMPAAPGRAWLTRRTLWGSALTVAAIVAAITAVTLNEEGTSRRSHPSPAISTGAPTPGRPSPPSLPLSAVHDAHGLIVTLPDIRRILGPTPLPGVTLSENQLTNKNIAQFKVSEETNDGHTDSASQYREFDLRLTKFPSVGSIKHTYGKVGPDPQRIDMHHWIGPSTHITRLGGPGIIYQYSNGPYKANIPNRTIEFDYIGPTVEARFRNVAIYISYQSADFIPTQDGKIKVVYPPYTRMRDDLIKITRKITSHL